MEGSGSSILEYVSDNFPSELSKIKRIGLQDKFTEKYGSQDELFKKHNLTAKFLVKKITS